MSVDVNEMFKELVMAGVITYGGSDGANGCGFSAGVTYSETFAKCFSGVCKISSYRDLEDLYNKWVQSGRTRCGVIAWLSVKIGHLPLFFYADRPNYDLSTLNLPPNPDDQYYRDLFAKIDSELIV